MRRSRSNSRTVASRKAIISRNFHVVSTCNSGNGILDGKKALRARWSITLESFPIEYNMTGLRNSAAISRNMNIDSASSALSREASLRAVISGSLAQKTANQPANVIDFAVRQRDARRQADAARIQGFGDRQRPLVTRCVHGLVADQAPYRPRHHAGIDQMREQRLLVSRRDKQQIEPV